MKKLETSPVLAKGRYNLSRKVAVVMIGAITSFSFANHALIDMNLPIDQNEPYDLYGPCDGYGGTLTINVTVNCDGDGTPEVQGSVVTCADQAVALIEHYKTLCD